MAGQQFEEWLTCYGATIADWPALERELMEQALVHNAALRARVEEERVFEAELSALDVPVLSTSLAERISTAARALPQEQPASLATWWRATKEDWAEIFMTLNVPKPALSFASVLLVGLFVGYLQAPESRQAHNDMVSAYGAFLTDSGEIW